MKKSFLIAIAILSLIMFSVNIFAQSKPVVRTHILRVESINHHKGNIPFTFVYSCGDSSSTSPIITIEKTTPFKMEITSENFVGLIQDKSLHEDVKVFVTTFENGLEIGSAECNFLLNVIHIDKEKSTVSSYRL
jgi:hypothetical protein